MSSASIHRWLAVGAVTLASGWLCSTGVIAHQRYSNVTWANDIRPIFQRRCVACHHANGFGQIRLDNYADAKAWASSIRQQVLEAAMPPSAPGSGFKAFTNDQFLTLLERDLIVSWADGGTPEGTERANERPVAPVLSERQPDVVLAPPRPEAINNDSVRFVFPTDVDRPRWIDKWGVRPGNARAVQRVVVTVLPTGPVGTWVPGEQDQEFTEGAGQQLPSRGTIAVDVSYRRTSGPESDQTKVLLWLGKGSPKRILKSRTFGCGRTQVDRPIRISSVSPYLPSAGEPVEVVAYPSTSRTPDPIIVIPRFKPAYQPAYLLRTPVLLEAGSVLEVFSAERNCRADIVYTEP